MIEFKFKIQLIGYYWSNNQFIKPENKYISDADMLRTLLNKTFSEQVINNISDTQFINAFRTNGVFIFQDKNNRYYAFSPSLNIARISNIIYNPSEIKQVPKYMKTWFIPGDYFFESYEDRTKKQFKTLSGKIYNYLPSDISIDIRRNEFYIYFKKYGYTLSEDLQDVSIEYINEQINLKWSYFVENKVECYDNCDGWDYSNCDMDRCKNDCTTCGGRRFRCNNICFVKRNNTAVEIEIDNESVDYDTQKGTALFEATTRDNQDNLFLDDLYCNLIRLKKYNYNNYKADLFIHKYNTQMNKDLEKAMTILNTIKPECILSSTSILTNDEEYCLAYTFYRYINSLINKNINISFFERYILYKHRINLEDINKGIQIIENIVQKGLSNSEESFLQTIKDNLETIPEKYQTDLIRNFITIYENIPSLKETRSINEGINMIININKQHSLLYKQLVPSDLDWLKELYKFCKTNQTSQEKSELCKKYIKEYEKMSKLITKRKSNKCNLIIRIINTNDIKYIIEYSDVKIMDWNILWGNDVKIEINGYDRYSDCFIEKSYLLKLSKDKSNLLKMFKEKKLENISFKLNNDGKYDVKWEGK